MSDYSRNYDFSVKDGLSTGNPAKLIKGSEVDDEFDDIATAIATKRDSADDVLANTLTTRGDLAVQGASAAQRLEIGTAGQQLISDGTDPVWTTKPGWEFVDKLDAFDGTTQAEFTDLDAGYDHRFEFRNVLAETDSLFIARTSTTNGVGSPGYDEGAADYITSYAYTATNTSAVSGAVPGTTSMSISPYVVESTTSGLNGVTGDFFLFGIDTGTATWGIISCGHWNSSGDFSNVVGVSQRRDTTVVDAIEFSMVTDQIADGAIYHYRKAVGS